VANAPVKTPIAAEARGTVRDGVSGRISSTPDGGLSILGVSRAVAVQAVMNTTSRATREMKKSKPITEPNAAPVGDLPISPR
jgi:hypothetical protein